MNHCEHDAETFARTVQANDQRRRAALNESKLRIIPAALRDRKNPSERVRLLMEEKRGEFVPAIKLAGLRDRAVKA